MYATTFGFTGEPFRLSPDPQCHFGFRGFQRAWEHLAAALRRQRGTVLIAGAPGGGRTTLIRAMAHEPADPAQVLGAMQGTFCQGNDLWAMVADALGLPWPRRAEDGLPPEMDEALRRRVRRGQHTVLLVDEADQLGEDGLRRLGRLAQAHICGHPLAQVCLAGTAALAPAMERHFGAMPLICQLEPLTAAEIEGYVRYRLERVAWQGNPGFENAAFAHIYEHTGGSPRGVNQLCSRLMLHAAVSGLRTLGAADVDAVQEELDEEWSAPLSGL